MGVGLFKLFYFIIYVIMFLLTFQNKMYNIDITFTYYIFFFGFISVVMSTPDKGEYVVLIISMMS